MAKTKRRLFLASATILGVGVGAVFGSIAFSAHHDAGKGPVISDQTDMLSTKITPASATGYLTSVAGKSWVIFLDPAGGTVDATSYSNADTLGNGGEVKVNVEHGTVSGYGETVDFIGINVAGLNSCPCRALTDGSNLQILIPTKNELLETLTFYPSSVAAYNSAVSGLNARAARVNQDRQHGAND